MSSSFLFDKVEIVGQNSTLIFDKPLAGSAWFRRKTLLGTSTYISNVIRIEIIGASAENLNYIREIDILVSGVKQEVGVKNLPADKKHTVSTYFDGLGRITQVVLQEAGTPKSESSPWQDIVQIYEYDAFGVQQKQYLPYTTPTMPGKYKFTATGEQSSYYANPETFGESSPFAQLAFAKNPLMQTANIKAPGTSWAAAKGVSIDYELNTLADQIQEFRIGYFPESLPDYQGAFAAGQLYKTTSTDENGKKVQEFKNAIGQTLVTKTQVGEHPQAYDGWICLYYIYDDFGKLRFVMQPEAVKWLSVHNWSFNSIEGKTVADDLCFRYEYDEKGRNILKKAPGAMPLKMIYDLRDRLVFTQDGNQATKTVPEWTVYLYDELDRLVLSTLYSTTKTRTQLEAALKNSPAGTTITLRNTDVPVAVNLNTYNNPLSMMELNSAASCTILSIFHYDNYSFPRVQAFDPSYTNRSAYAAGGDVMPIQPSKRTTGAQTGSWVRVLSSKTFLTSTAYYDEQGNTIQNISDNILLAGHATQSLRQCIIIQAQILTVSP